MVPFSPLAWRMLDAGRADIFIENKVVGIFEVQKTLGTGNHLEYGTTVPLKKQNLYLVFSRNHKDGLKLLRLFDETISQLKADGQLPKHISGQSQTPN